MDRSFHRKSWWRRKNTVLDLRPSANKTMDSFLQQLSSSLTSAFAFSFWIFALSSCFVGSVHGTEASDLSTLPVFRFIREPALTTLTESGGTATLDCLVHNSEERPDIHWTREGGKGQPGLRLVDRPTIYKLSNGSLHFTKVTDPADTGYYRCAASVRGVGTIVSRRAKLEVTYLRKPLQRQPSDLALAPGDTAAFQCLVEAQPLPTVKWYRGNARVTQGQGINIYPSGLLEIGPLKPSDYNTYRCLVEVPGDRVRSRAAVLSQLPATNPKLRGAPKFVVQPLPQRAVKGETVYLHCVAFGRDAQGKPPIVSWLKDGRTMSTGQQDGRMEVVGAGTLVIKSVVEDDTGVYTCRAVNGDDTADAEATLTVLVHPIIVDRPSNKAALTGTDVQLACSAQGVPEPDVTWYKDGIPVMLNHYHQTLPGGDLQILGAMASDAGMYQCLAGNSLGDTQASARLLVYQGDAPPLSGRRPGARFYPYALSAEALHSENRRKPPTPRNLEPILVSPRHVTVAWELQRSQSGREDTTGLVYSVVWSAVGSERERVSNTTAQELRLRRLRPSTEYEVRVRSYNSQGPSEGQATLRVTTKPEALVPSVPQNLQATPISSTEIVVRWDDPLEANGGISAYDVYYHKVGSKEQKRRITRTSLKLKALDEYSKYSFRVAAVNVRGVGSSTGEVIVRTFSDKPSESPQNLTLEVTSSSILVVRWQPPPVHAQNGIITGYKIRRRRKGDKQGGETVTTAGDRNTYALKDLRKGTEYQVRVAAMTANGTGPTTHWASAATFREDLDESRPPDKPSGLFVVAKANSLEVSWTPPLPNSKVLVRGYYLGYGLLIPNVMITKLGPEARHYVIEQLSPNSLYVLSLQAHNKRGPSEARLTEVRTLKKDVDPEIALSPPLGITASVQSSSSVRLTWSDSTLREKELIQDLRYYTVRYRSQSSRRGKWRAVNATDQSTTIKNLRPYTEYEFQVMVTLNRRSSDVSMSVFATTDERAPSTEPRDVTPVPLRDNPLAVSLNWQPPARPNGQITDYLIYYTTHLHTEDIVWPVEGVVGESLTTVIDNLTPDTTYYFKVQARNSKGVSPKSKPVKYVTLPAPKAEPAGEEEEAGVTLSLPIIAGACVGIVFLISLFSLGIFYLCRRRSQPGAITKSPKGPPPVQGMKPPDLWTHQPSNLELNKLGRSNRSESSASVATSTLRRGSRGSADQTDDQGSTLDRRRNSFVGEGGYLSSGEERYQPIQPRNLIRPKPVMVPVDGPGGFRDGMGNGPPTPLLQYGDAPGGPLPMRPIYPRTQYSAQYGAPYSNPARVNAGDLPHSCPNNSKALTVVAETDKDGDLPSGLEDSYNSRIGYVKPQQNISPYRKPNAPVTTPTPHNKGQRTPVPFNSSSKSPETKIKKEDADLSKSLSTEELTAEMANLEGLMKDLNAITQQEFEC